MYKKSQVLPFEKCTSEMSRKIKKTLHLDKSKIVVLLVFSILILIDAYLQGSMPD